MNNYFAKNLKYLRKEKKWSQSELARRTAYICKKNNEGLPENEKIKPITQASIARWEAGENSPSIDNLVLLEETLQVKLPDLIGNDLADSNINHELSSEDEKEIFREFLKRKGFLNENEELTDKTLDNLINFATINKKFIMDSNKK